MKSLFTVSGVVLAHICVFLLLVNGCRGPESAPETWGSDTSIYSGGARSSAVPAEAEPVLPAEAEPVPAEAKARPEPARPAPAASEADAEKSAAPFIRFTSASGKETVYVVKKGDYLSTIGLRHGVTAKEIADANGIGLNDKILVGQKLKIPAAKPKAEEKKVVAEGEIYVVQKGDVLGTIARKHKISVAQLKKANNLKSDMIRVGQKLVIPTKKAAGTPEKSAAPAEKKSEEKAPTEKSAPAAKPAEAPEKPADSEPTAKEASVAEETVEIDENFGMPEGGFRQFDEAAPAENPEATAAPAEAVPAEGTPAA